MEALIPIGWIVWLLVSIWLIFCFVGFRGLVNMFPEGYCWWHLPSQLGTLAHFAAVILLHPF